MRNAARAHRKERRGDRNALDGAFSHGRGRVRTRRVTGSDTRRTVRTLVALDQDDKAWLDRQAARLHVSMTELVREAVCLAWLHDACGTCEDCITGWETLCEAQHNSGCSVNGAFAEYVIGSAAYVGRLLERPDFAAMAPITCAGVTTYEGIKETEARPGHWLAISGIGGLGQSPPTPSSWRRAASAPSSMPPRSPAPPSAH